jgi:hypothetical protein
VSQLELLPGFLLGDVIQENLEKSKNDLKTKLI